MSHYIQQLKAASQAASARRFEETIINRSAEADAARERMTPLADRLRRLLATIPASERDAGLSLSVLQPRLRGRRGRGCSSSELGQALRGLGWTRKRGWGAGTGDGFGASWFPPGSA